MIFQSISPRKGESQMFANYRLGRGYRTLRLVLSIWTFLLGGLASSALAVVPTPDVTGPLASDPRGSVSRNYTFFATDLDLASRGFVEEEFFFAGTANVYDAPNPFPIGAGLGAAPTANVISSGHPYKTRMVVRRPANARQFNGTVIVEWTNVTSGYDVEALWFRIHEFIMREGYAWVGVSAQTNGISASPNGLKLWSPARYGTLDVTDSGAVTGDGLSYDIFAQAMQAVRSVPPVMGGLPVDRVIAAGVSQSAGRISVYVNAVHPRDAIADAALLYIGGTRIRDDLAIPVLKLLSETEYVAPQVNELPSLQPDTERIRVWGMAGTSHSDWASFVVRYAILRRDLPAVPLFDSCTLPSRSRIPDRYVISAAIDAIVKWVDQGVQPPHAPEFAVTSISPPAVARDPFGNALGGIRLASFAVPVALDQGSNTGPGTCFLNGTHIPFDTLTLNSLYPTHHGYVKAVKEAADQNVEDGFVLEDDAKELLANANKSIVGKGLTCGPLCANVAQFPLNPSTSILRDHTQFYYFVGGEELLATLDQATEWVANGYTEAGQSDDKSQEKSKKSFARAIGFLENYIDKVEQMARGGRAAPESAALLVDFANILITKLQPLT
jgi:Alpha/beta hydrolase domain